MFFALPLDYHNSRMSSLMLSGDVCRFVANPLNDCYCYAITADKVPLALYFCSGHYRECSIFRQHAEQSEASSEPLARSEDLGNI